MVDLIIPRCRKLFKTNKKFVIETSVGCLGLALMVALMPLFYIPLMVSEKDARDILTFILLLVGSMMGGLLYLYNFIIPMTASFFLALLTVYIISYIFLIGVLLYDEIRKIELTKRDMREHKLRSIL
jgi:hypothetical protein